MEIRTIGSNFGNRVFKEKERNPSLVIPIPNLETRINDEILQEWTEMLPGCRRFLENFFSTCKTYPPEVNFLNYVRDLRLYSPSNKQMRENGVYLVQAFYEITGVTETEIRKRLAELL